MPTRVNIKPWLCNHFKMKIDVANRYIASGREEELSKNILYGRRIDFSSQEYIGTTSQAPTFYMPFEYGTWWKTTTYERHPDCGQNSWDWNGATEICAWKEDNGLLVLASAAGTADVRPDPYPGQERGWGNQILITHSGGYWTRSAHLNDFTIVDGAVSGGQIIGHVGNSGNTNGTYHLHTDRKLNGQCVAQTFVEGLPSQEECMQSKNLFCPCR